jgi:excinuclease ABC subunit C
MRDDAHRFAVSSHRRWKRREDVASVLEQIEGVGKKRTMLLLKTFASIDDIRAAGVEGLSRVPGITRKVAENVIGFL